MANTHPLSKDDLIGLVVIGFAQLVSWTGLQLAPTLGGPVIVGLTRSLAFAGLPLGVAFLASAVAARLMHRLVPDASGSRPLQAGALIGGTGATLAAVSAPMHSVILLLVGIGVEGFGIGWCWLARYAASRFLGPGRGTVALGLTVGAAGVGAVSGPLTIPLVKSTSDSLGLDPSLLPWLLVAVLFLVLAMIAPRISDAGDTSLDLMSKDLMSDRKDANFSVSGLPRLIAVFCVVQGVMTAVMGIAPAVWSGGTVPGLALAVIMSIHFLGMFGVAPALARYLRPSNTPSALGLACLITAASVLGLVRADTSLTRAAGMFGVGLGWSLAYLALSVQLIAIPDDARRPVLQARNDFLAQLVGGLTPLLGGLVLSIIGFDVVLIGLAVVSAMATLGITWRTKSLA